MREAIGSWPALRLDANGVWTVDEAIERIHGARGERPRARRAAVRDAARARRGAQARVDADRGRRVDHRARRRARRGRGARACDAVNVKLASCGGVERARAAIRTAGESGIAAYLSSTFDGPWGISAALQLAAGETFQLACGLATLELFDSPLAELLKPARGGLHAGAGRARARDRGRRRPALRGARPGTSRSSAATASGSSSCGACPAAADRPRTRRRGSRRRHPPAAPRRTARRARRRCSSTGTSSSREPVPDRRHDALAEARSRSRRARAGSCERRPGAGRRTSSGDWVAKTGCASQRSTTSSIGCVSIHVGELLVGRARARPASSTPALTPTSTSAGQRSGSASARVEHDPPAHRVPDRHHARLGAARRAVEKNARIAFSRAARRQAAQASPRCMNPGRRRASASPCDQSTAPTHRCRRWPTSWCGAG